VKTTARGFSQVLTACGSKSLDPPEDVSLRDALRLTTYPSSFKRLLFLIL